MLCYIDLGFLFYSHLEMLSENSTLYVVSNLVNNLGLGAFLATKSL